MTDTITPVIIRTSDRGMFKRCREMWNMTSKMRQNYEPIARYIHFDFGTAIHAAMEAYYWPTTWQYRKLREFNAVHVFKQTHAELMQKVRVGDVQFEIEFTEAYDVGLRMLEFYFTWAPQQDKYWRPIFVEIEFEVPIPGLFLGICSNDTQKLHLQGPHCENWISVQPFVYQGRIDLVVEVFDEEGNSLGYFIVDHKTAGSFGEPQWLWLDDQCSSYAWALQKMLGLKIQGVIYNQLKKSPPHPPKQLKNGGFSVAKNQDTSFDVYLRTLRDHDINPSYYREFLSFLKHNPKEYVRRTKVNYTQQQLSIVEERIKREAREMANPEISIYPTPSQWNCNSCRFLRPCMQIQEGREPSMDNYEVRT